MAIASLGYAPAPGSCAPQSTRSQPLRAHVASASWRNRMSTTAKITNGNGSTMAPNSQRPRSRAAFADRDGGPVQARARHHLAPGVRDRGRRPQGAEFLRQQLSRPRRQRGAARSGEGRARPLRLRHGLGALHLRHAGGAQAARGADLELPRHGGHDPLRPASMPMAACSRRCWARRTRSSPTRSTTPRSSTASGSPKPSASATPTTTWRRSRRN